MTIPSHFAAQTEWDKLYLKNKIRIFKQESKKLGEFARKLINRHGVFSLRRLWLLQSLLKRYGADKLNKAIRECQEYNLKILFNKLNSNKFGLHNIPQGHPEAKPKDLESFACAQDDGFRIRKKICKPDLIEYI